MRCNNNHILKGSDKSEKIIERLLSFEEDKIKNDNHKNIMSSK